MTGQTQSELCHELLAKIIAARLLGVISEQETWRLSAGLPTQTTIGLGFDTDPQPRQQPQHPIGAA